MIRSVLTNMYEMEQFLQTTKDVTWTVVRPPGLKNLPASGKDRQAGGQNWNMPKKRAFNSLILKQQLEN